MYSRIKNPETSRYVKIDSKKGRQILNKYMSVLNSISQDGGGFVIIDHLYEIFNISDSKKNDFTEIYNIYSNLLSISSWKINRKYLNDYNIPESEINDCQSEDIDKCTSIEIDGDSTLCKVYTSSSGKDTCRPKKMIKTFKKNSLIKINGISGELSPSTVEIIEIYVLEEVSRVITLLKVSNSNKYIMLFPFGHPVVPKIPIEVTTKIDEIISDETNSMYLCGHSMGTGLIQKLASDNIDAWSSKNNLNLIMTAPLAYKDLASDFNTRYIGNVVTFNFAFNKDNNIIYDDYASLVLDNSQKHDETLETLKKNKNYNTMFIITIVINFNSKPLVTKALDISFKNYYEENLSRDNYNLFSLQVFNGIDDHDVPHEFNFYKTHIFSRRSARFFNGI